MRFRIMNAFQQSSKGVFCKCRFATFDAWILALGARAWAIKAGKHAIFSKTNYKYMYAYRERLAVYVFRRLSIPRGGWKKKIKNKNYLKNNTKIRGANTGTTTHVGTLAIECGKNGKRFFSDVTQQSLDDVQDHRRRRRRRGRVRAVWSGARSGPVNKPGVSAICKGPDFFFYIIYRSMYAKFFPYNKRPTSFVRPPKRVGRRTGHLPSTEARAASVAKTATAMAATAETRPAVGMAGRRVADGRRRDETHTAVRRRVTVTSTAAGPAGRERDVDDGTASEPSAHVSGDQLPAGSAGRSAAAAAAAADECSAYAATRTPRDGGTPTVSKHGQHHNITGRRPGKRYLR